MLSCEPPIMLSSRPKAFTSSSAVRPRSLPAMATAPRPLMVPVLSQQPYTSKPVVAPRRAAMSSPRAKAAMNSAPVAPARSAQAKAVGTVVPEIWAALDFWFSFSASMASKS